MEFTEYYSSSTATVTKSIIAGITSKRDDDRAAWLTDQFGITWQSGLTVLGGLCDRATVLSRDANVDDITDIANCNVCLMENNYPEIIY